MNLMLGMACEVLTSSTLEPSLLRTDSPTEMRVPPHLVKVFDTSTSRGVGGLYVRAGGLVVVGATVVVRVVVGAVVVVVMVVVVDVTVVGTAVVVRLVVLSAGVRAIDDGGKPSRSTITPFSPDPSTSMHPVSRTSAKRAPLSKLSCLTRVAFL